MQTEPLKYLSLSLRSLCSEKKGLTDSHAAQEEPSQVIIILYDVWMLLKNTSMLA
jgi:hypothetical protein